MWWNPTIIFLYPYSVDSMFIYPSPKQTGVFYNIRSNVHNYNSFLNENPNYTEKNLCNINIKSGFKYENILYEYRVFEQAIQHANYEYNVNILGCLFNSISSQHSTIEISSPLNLSKVVLTSSYFHSCKSNDGCGAVHLTGFEFISKGNCFAYLSSINHTDTVLSEVSQHNEFNFSSIVLCGEESDATFGNSVIVFKNGDQIIFLANTTQNSIQEGYSGFQFYNPKTFVSNSLTILSNYKGSVLSVRTSNTYMGLENANIVNNTATKLFPLIIFKQNLFQISNAVFIFNSGDHFASREDILEGGSLEIFSSSFDIRNPISRFIVFYDCVFSTKGETRHFNHLRTGICLTIPQKSFGIGDIIAIVMSIVLLAFIIIVCFCCGKKKCPKFTMSKSDQLP